MSAILVSAEFLHHADIVKDYLEAEYPHLAFDIQESMGEERYCVVVTSGVTAVTRLRLAAFARGVLLGYLQAL